MSSEEKQSQGRRKRRLEGNMEGGLVRSVYETITTGFCDRVGIELHMHMT